jgi:hypothetical protein
MKQIRGTVLITAVAAALLLSAPNAFADEIKTFDVVATIPPIDFSPGSTGVIGTITIDTTTGVVDAIDLKTPGDADYISTDSGIVDPPTINSIYFQESWCVGPAPACFGVEGYNIVIPQVALVGYDGGLICSTDDPCFGDTSAYSFGMESVEYTSGRLEPTPEPSSLILALTGALGMCVALRRKNASSDQTVSARSI